MQFEVGSLVRARGREWVVLPESRQEPDTLVLRPLGGTEDEVTGIYLPLEKVEPAEFPLPDPQHDMGNDLSCRLLRDAVRLGFRSGAGPFRSLSRIGIEPRPYQIVPLLMALKMDPVRMLIADDVGIGKTIEACLIARELLDRGEIRRIALLSPPHLAEQWQRALRDQFHINAALVLASTAARLERECGPGETLFDLYPHVVVSTDYIKSPRRRDTFVHHCPELVIVDEAHGCASGGVGRAAQQRHELLKELTRKQERHLILVTATPHSGKEETFRSLLCLLHPDLSNLPEDLSGEANRKHREHLARHFVQRRRKNLESYLDIETPFPERELAEEQYTLHKDYRSFFDRVLDYCRETVLDESLNEHRRRVRWWSALALLRAVASSPAAAAETMRNRAASADTETPREADEVGRRTVLDLDEDDAEGIDVVPGSQEDDDEKNPEHRRLLRLAKEVEALAGEKDAKLIRAGQLVKRFLKDGYAPILFCRFIPTVHYVVQYLRSTLPKDVVIEGVTGMLPPRERENRVDEIANQKKAGKKAVLVCTDCLSEGINLQDHFDAVMHYDLSWNPTRHEQREGRVDRYGQPSSRVRTLTYYGKDNPVDGIVLEVLLRKHKAIRKQLGITVPVPMDTNAVIEAIFQGLLLRETGGSGQLSFGFLEKDKQKVDVEWDAAADRETKSRSIFAQHSIKVEEVAHEVAESRRALGGETDVRSFSTTTLKLLGATVSGTDPIEVDLGETPAALRDALDEDQTLKLSFSGRPQKDAIQLTRTHPIVESLAAHVMETALDPRLEGPGRRCGVIRTKDVTIRTTLLLLRLRFHIVNEGRDGKEQPLLAEDQVLVGFTGSPDKAVWLETGALEPLLGVQPHANIAPELAVQQVSRVLERFASLRPELDRVAKERGKAVLESHRRVRKAAQARVRALRVEPHLPADILGVFVYLPATGGDA